MSNNTNSSRRRFALGLSLAVASLMALPASGLANAKFGTDLSGPLDPVATPAACDYAPMQSCTRVPEYYDAPSHVGNVPNAPKNGTIKKIKLVSDTPGNLRVQLAKTKGYDQTFQAKIKHEGPKLHYKGTGSIEKFNVSIPVGKGEWLAVRAKNLGAVQCDPNDYDHEAQFQPALSIGGMFASPDELAPCQALIQAVIK